MATQIIEFAADDGETFTAVKACLAGADSPIKTSNSVAAVANHPGLYRATFTDQGLTEGLWRFWGVNGSTFIGRGLATIDAAAGTFRETIEATAEVDSSSIATEVVAGIAEDGVVVSGFTVEAIDQLRANNVVVEDWDPDTDFIRIFRGADHLTATGNSFRFRSLSGAWPNLTGCTIQMEVEVDFVRATIGTGTIIIATGPGQEVKVQVLRTAFDGTKIVKGTGTFHVVRIDDSDNRFVLASGVAIVKNATAPA